jgi:hypothetical protein
VISIAAVHVGLQLLFKLSFDASETAKYLGAIIPACAGGALYLSNTGY